MTTLTKNTEPPIAVYHTVEGEIHKGYGADCNHPKCRRKRLSRKTSAQMARERGHEGGKKSGANKHRHCKGCKKRINKENKTGRCRACYEAWMKEKYAKTKLPPAERKTCLNCGTLLDRRNLSGYCRKHYRESANYAAQVEEFSGFITAGVFRKTVEQKNKAATIPVNDETIPPKKQEENRKQCQGCGSTLGKRNKSGRCRGCYQKWVAEQHEARLKAKGRRSTCRECGKKIHRNNKSGYCNEHYNQSTKRMRQND